MTLSRAVFVERRELQALVGDDEGPLDAVACSSRTLPGQLCCLRVMRDKVEKCLCVPACVFSSSSTRSAISTASLPRTRSGGISMGNTASRYSRSSRSWPLRTAVSGQRLVAAMTRTSQVISCGAGSVELAGLEQAQQPHLHVHRQLGDLVEQHGAALRARSNTPGLLPRRTARSRSAPPGMAPQLMATNGRRVACAQS